MLDDLAARTNAQVRPGYPDGAGEAYRYRRLAPRTVLADMRFERTAPKPGDHIPDFDLPTVDGARIRSRDLQDVGPLLLVFGSLSCPMTDSAAPGLRDLHQRHGRNVRFVVVNVREAHPGDALPQPRTPAEKLEHAWQLRDLHALPFDVAVDDIDGTFHRAMSAKPNSAYLIQKNGRIILRAHWANDVASLERALQEIASDRNPCPRQSGGLMLPMLRMMPYLAPVLDRAGRGAWTDMWRVMAPMAAMAMAGKLLGLGRGTLGPHDPVRRNRNASTE